jgi:hypothetical protein
MVSKPFLSDFGGARYGAPMAARLTRATTTNMAMRINGFKASLTGSGAALGRLLDGSWAVLGAAFGGRWEL